MKLTETQKPWRGERRTRKQIVDEAIARLREDLASITPAGRAALGGSRDEG